MWVQPSSTHQSWAFGAIPDQMWRRGLELEELANSRIDVVLWCICCLFREPEERTHDDSAAAAPSVLVSHEDPTAAASQLIPLVRGHTHTHAHWHRQTNSMLQSFSVWNLWCLLRLNTLRRNSPRQWIHSSPPQVSDSEAVPLSVFSLYYIPIYLWIHRCSPEKPWTTNNLGKVSEVCVFSKVLVCIFFYPLMSFPLSPTVPPPLQVIPPQPGVSWTTSSCLPHPPLPPHIQ